MFKYFIISLLFSVFITYGQGQAYDDRIIVSNASVTDDGSLSSAFEMSTVNPINTMTQNSGYDRSDSTTATNNNPNTGSDRTDSTTVTNKKPNTGSDWTDSMITTAINLNTGSDQTDSTTVTSKNPNTGSDRTDSTTVTTKKPNTGSDSSGYTNTGTTSSTTETNTATITSFTSQTMTTVTTVAPPRLLFSCDFNDSTCFEGALNSTDGTEFTTNQTNVPPRAPTSDYSATNSSTVDNKTCNFPFQPTINAAKANWSVSFCYNRQCLTTENETADCQLGRYGLLSLNSSESSKTINQTISLNSTIRSDSRRGRLSYYYFFTMSKESDWGQQMRISIIYNESESSIGNITVAGMTENKWYSGNSYFKLPASDFTLSIRFEASPNISSNESIYFALDDIMIYDEAEPDTTTTTSTTTPAASSEKNLGLILGLSLGLGIPALLGVGLGAAHYIKTRKKHDQYYSDEYQIDRDDGEGKETGYSYATTSF